MIFKDSPKINNPALFALIKKQEQQNGEFLNPFIAAMCKHNGYISASCSDLDNYTIINRLLIAFDWKGHNFKEMSNGQIHAYREMSLAHGLIFVAVCQDSNIQKIERLKVFMPTVETPFFNIDFPGFMLWVEWAIYNGVKGRFLEALIKGKQLKLSETAQHIYQGRQMSPEYLKHFCEKEGLTIGE